MKIILFVCGHNAGRSQMAEAYFNHLHKKSEWKAYSAGTHPTENINPVVKKVLEEEGMQTLHLFPKMITAQMENNAEKIFTMGCGVDCSVFSSGKEIKDLGLQDPHGEGIESVRKIFREIKNIIDSPLFLGS